MKIVTLLWAFVIAVATPASLPGGPRDSLEDQLLRASDDAGLLAQKTVTAFYQERDFAPAWTTSFRPNAQAREMLSAINEVMMDGLTPANYHEARIRKFLDRGKIRNLTERDVAELEVLLADAFFMMATHLRHGCVDPVTIDSEWFLKLPESRITGVLEGALESGGIREALASFRPPQGEYQGLVRALSSYRNIASEGGWEPVVADSTLRLGSMDPAVPALRARLRASGDLTAGPDDSPVFDEELAASVRGFQRRHGLSEDGAVGLATRAALNVSVNDRIDQILVNLERWKWLPADLGERHVIVNIAAFGLSLVETGRDTLSMRVVTGRPYRRTPVFSDHIQYLVLNPSWSVPLSIAAKDLFPKFRQDPGEIDRMGYRISLADGGKVSLSEIDWKKPRAYRVTQMPGPKNALGRVKFMFPNSHNVYLHDTSQPDLFAKEDRAFSSGCIRIQKPLELAERLLEGSEWTRAAINKQIETGRERRVNLPIAVPVHLLYWTAWVDEAGVLHFRKDVYGRDEPLLKALVAGPEYDR